MISLKKIVENIKKRWSAVVLDDGSRNRLIAAYKSQIPSGWEVIAHHMTINPFELTDDEGKRVTLQVISVGKSDKALAVKVSGYDRPTKNSFAHVTIAINRAGGAKPKDSNDIRNWVNVEPITLTGTVENL